jgi:hypothetical protein
MVRKGPGDYLVASPTFPLMLKKVLPIFLRLFERLMQLGHFVGGKNIFLFSDEGCLRLWGHDPEDQPRVLFGHAGDPESLESAKRNNECSSALSTARPSCEFGSGLSRRYVILLSH